MNSPVAAPAKRSRIAFFSFFASLALMLTFAVSLYGQQPQLTLADLLIGLRSKRVTLPERNTILAEAVKQRGVTFVLTPDIEKELTTTGAAKVLLDAIREKTPVAVVPAPTPAPTPVPTPTPPDFSYYQTRADANLNKGEFALALADYDKAVELKPDDAVAFLNRGRTHYNLKSFDKAGADYDKAIQLDPKDSKAFYNRGVLFERLGNGEKALADYRRALELDGTNEPAKAGVKKLVDEQQARTAAANPPPVTVPVQAPPEPVKAPESMNLGSLTAANAVRMVMPQYSGLAQKANVEGKVVVNVELDVEGNVVTAKAVSGNQLLRGAAEDAAKRSKFKPALFNSQPIKAIGTITYNFSLKAQARE